MSFGSEAIKHIFQHLLETLAGVSHAVFDAIRPAIAGAAGDLLGQVLPLAESAVLSFATAKGKSGADKRAAAFDQIKQAAVAAGINAGTSVINLAIETAVQKLAVGAIAPTTKKGAASTEVPTAAE